MGIFNIFNKKSDNESAATVSLPVVEPSEAKEVVESVAYVSIDRTETSSQLLCKPCLAYPFVL